MYAVYLPELRRSRLTCVTSDILNDFTKHRDAKIRQHAVLAVSNLFTNPDIKQRLIEVKAMDAFVAFSFPPTTSDAVNSQYQAIAGLHGVSQNPELRFSLLRQGALEPLTIAAQGNNKFSCVEVQREAAAALSNLALAEPNRLLLSKSGALPALINMLKGTDMLCQALSGRSCSLLASFHYSVESGTVTNN